MDVLPSCMSTQYMCALCPKKSEEGVGYSGNGVRDSCELPFGCWDLDL